MTNTRIRSPHIILLTIAPLLVTGCASLSNPIKVKTIGDVHIASMEATNRAIIASHDSENSTYIFCAEPPPDAVSNFAQSLSAAIEAEIDRPGGNTKAAITAASSLAKSVEKIYSRSHAVQLFRDASFSLCQAYLIGASRNNSAEGNSRTHTEITHAKQSISDECNLFLLRNGLNLMKIRNCIEFESVGVN